VSVHNPASASEIGRVIQTVRALEANGICSGVNLLVARSRLAHARAAAKMLREADIANDRITYLPLRGEDTPTAAEVASVAGGPFQSMTCLRGCAKSDRFASVASDRTVAWCSYTRSRRRLEDLTHYALTRALDGLPLAPCFGALVRVDQLTRTAHAVAARSP
jgi:hypothetical protein